MLRKQKEYACMFAFQNGILERKVKEHKLGTEFIALVSAQQNQP